MNEIFGEIALKKFEEKVKSLASSEVIKQPTCSVYLFGQGGQPMRFYHDLRKSKDLEIIWTGWPGKWFWKIFRWIPGEYGIIEIRSISKIPELIESVGSGSFCSLIYFPSNLKNKVNEEVKSLRWKYKFESIFSLTNDYFILNVDYDFSSEKDVENIYWKVQYGDDLNPEIKEILKKK